MTAADFEAITPDLPTHQQELMTAHPGAPAAGGLDVTGTSGVPVASEANATGYGC